MFAFLTKILLFFKSTLEHVSFIFSRRMQFETTHAFVAIERNPDLSEDNRTLTIEAAKNAWNFVHLDRDIQDIQI